MKPIKIGIFGMGRGKPFIDIVMLNNGVVAAICERDEQKLATGLKDAGPDAVGYTDFEEFIKHDMDCVFLANYFHDHAKYAIRLLEKGIHVLSECTSNCTMAEGVALMRAAEKSKAYYMLAENYPFLKFNMEMRRIYRSGSMGKALFCEGEYNHPMDIDGADQKVYMELHPYAKHWRNYLPRTYYITHSLAPLMYITGGFPKRVTAFGCFAPRNDAMIEGSLVGDRAAIITTLNDDDSVYRVTGCAAFGAHENSYRVCCTKGQMENDRITMDLQVMYNEWDKPAELPTRKFSYPPQHPKQYRALAEKTGHDGSDFFVVKEFFDCIREGRAPEFDAHFSTTCASVAILAHRSLLEGGKPYDIPDLRDPEQQKLWENDHSSPMYSPDGTEPTIPCCSHPDYLPPKAAYEAYLKKTEEMN